MVTWETSMEPILSVPKPSSRGCRCDYVEAKPGSVLFLHCNLLHTSEANLSKFPRLAYICCYNAFSNIPILGAGHGPPVPIQLASDDAILQFA